MTEIKKHATPSALASAARRVAQVNGKIALDRHLLRANRRIFNISQSELASAIKRSQVWLSNVERGDAIPSSDETKKIALYLGLCPTEQTLVVWRKAKP